MKDKECESTDVFVVNTNNVDPILMCIPQEILPENIFIEIIKNMIYANNSKHLSQRQPNKENRWSNLF